MNDVQIRPAATKDFDAIYEFVCSLEDERFDKALLRQCYEVCLDTANTHYVMASIDDKPVGYISCHGQILLHHCGLVYEIQEMYVLPEYRSKGVGKILMDALMERIEKENYVLLEVASNMKRVDAHRFYEANGFVKTTYKFKKLP